jgi:hypothetical protein
VKEERSRFFWRIDVDLLVSSVREVDRMKLMQEEQYEYNKFMSELFRKGQEIQRDFDNLSPENQKRVYSELGKYVQIESVITFLQHISQ